VQVAAGGQCRPVQAQDNVTGGKVWWLTPGASAGAEPVGDIGGPPRQRPSPAPLCICSSYHLYDPTSSFDCRLQITTLTLRLVSETSTEHTLEDRLVTMRVSTILTSLAAATSVSAVSLFGDSQNVIASDDSLSVPGKNPLDVRCHPRII
jgi:hypothetical protein